MKCPWCQRPDVEISKKGGLLNHVNANGRKCIGVGMVVKEDARTLPKKIKGAAQRNLRKKH